MFVCMSKRCNGCKPALQFHWQGRHAEKARETGIDGVVNVALDTTMILRNQGLNLHGQLRSNESGSPGWRIVHGNNHSEQCGRMFINLCSYHVTSVLDPVDVYIWRRLIQCEQATTPPLPPPRSGLTRRQTDPTLDSASQHEASRALPIFILHAVFFSFLNFFKKKKKKGSPSMTKSVGDEMKTSGAPITSPSPPNSPPSPPPRRLDVLAFLHEIPHYLLQIGVLPRQEEDVFRSDILAGRVVGEAF